MRGVAGVEGSVLRGHNSQVESGFLETPVLLRPPEAYVDM